jgi:predicted AAA+ superfamily ATPase
MSFRSFCANLPGIGDLPDLTVRPADLRTPLAEDALWELSPFATALDDAWQLFLQVGGYPQAVADYMRDGDVSAAFVGDILDVVKGDVLRNSSLSEAETLALIDRLATNLCSPVNLSEVAEHVGLRDNDRVNGRVNGLVNNFLGWRCFRNRNGVPSPRSQRKLYFMDPLLPQLANRRNPSFPPVDAGKLNEQQVGLALNRCVTKEAPVEFIESGAVMYERTPTDAEIDFVGPALPVPIECKYVDSGWKREAQTMRSRYGAGVMATRGVLDLDGEIWAVPAATLVWMIGS